GEAGTGGPSDKEHRDPETSKGAAGQAEAHLSRAAGLCRPDHVAPLRRSPSCLLTRCASYDLWALSCGGSSRSRPAGGEAKDAVGAVAAEDVDRAPQRDRSRIGERVREAAGDGHDAPRVDLLDRVS